LTINSIAQYFIDVPETVCLSTTKELQLKAGGGTYYSWIGPNGFKSNEQNPKINDLTEKNSGYYTVLIDGKFPFTSLVSIGRSYYDANTVNYSFNNNQLKLYFNGNYASLKFEGPNNFKSDSNPSASIPLSSPNIQGIYTVTVKDYFGCTSNFTKDIKFENPQCIQNSLLYAQIDGGSRTYYPMENGELNNIKITYCNKADFSLNIDTTNLKNPDISWFFNNQKIENKSNKLRPSSPGYYHSVIVENGCFYQTKRILTNGKVSLSYYLGNKNSTSIIDSINYCIGGKEYLTFNGEDPNLFYKNRSFEFFKNDELLQKGSNKDFYATTTGSYTGKFEIDGCQGETKPLIINESKDLYLKIDINHKEFKGKLFKYCQSLNPIGVYVALVGNNIKVYKNNVLKFSTDNSSNFYVTEPGEYNFVQSGDNCSFNKTITFESGNEQKLSITPIKFSANCKNVEYFYLTGVEYNDGKGIQWIDVAKKAVVGSDYPLFYPNYPGGFYAVINNGTCHTQSDTIYTSIDGKSYLDGPKNIEIGKGEFAILSIKNCTESQIWFKDGIELKQYSHKCQIEVNEPGKYQIKLNADCNEFSNDINVTRNEKSNLLITKTCKDGSLHRLSINENNFSNIQWYKDYKLLNAFLNQNQIETSEPGTYYVIVKKDSFFIKSSDISIEKNKKTSTVLCSGEPYNLKAQMTADTYKWGGPNNFSSNNKEVLFDKFEKRNAGKYTLTTKDSDGCVVTEQYEIQVMDLPKFTVPDKIEACYGENINNWLTISKLTDSTETTNSLSIFRDGYQNTFYPGNGLNLTKSGVFNLKAQSNSLNFKVGGNETSKTCTYEKQLEIKVNEQCNKILVPDLSKMTYCNGDDILVPFSVTGSPSKNAVYTLKIVNYIEEPSIIIEIQSTKSPFIVKFDQIKEFYNGHFRISSSEKTTTPVSQNNVDLGRSRNYWPSIYQKYYCDSTVFDFSPYDSYQIDSLAIFKDGKLYKKLGGSHLVFTENGSYSLKYNLKKRPEELIHPYPCEYSQNIEINLLRPTSELSRIYEDGNSSFCKNGFTRLFASISSALPQNILKFIWEKDGKELPDFAGKTSIDVKESGKYRLKLLFNECEYITNEINISDQLNFSSIPLYIDGNDLSNNTYTICPHQNSKIHGSNSFSLNPSLPIWKEIKYELLQNKVFIDSAKLGDGESFNISEQGDYLIRGTLGRCSSIFASFKINHSETIASKISNTRDICENSSAIFNPVIPKPMLSNYKTIINSFYKYNNIVNSVISKPYYNYFEIKESGKYYVKTQVYFENNKTCTYVSDTLKLNVSNSIDYSKTVGEKYICDGSINPRFVGEFPSGYPLGYRNVEQGWYRNGIKVSNSPSVYEGSFSESGDYYYYQKTKEGCELKSVTTRLIAGKINPKLTISAKPGYLNNIYDRCSTLINTSNLYVEGLNDSKDFTTEFFKDGKSISKLENKYSLNKEINSGSYFVKVVQGNCAATSNTVDFKAIEVPKINFSSPLDLCNGKEINLSVSADPNFKINWEKDGKILSESNQQLKVTSPGNYRVFITSDICNEKSIIINIPLTHLPENNLISNDTVVCPEKKISLNFEGIPDSKYNLLLNDKLFESKNEPDFTISEAGKYILNYQKRSCNTFSKPFTLSSKIKLDVTASDSTYCKGSNLTLAAFKDVTYQYQWYKNLELIPNENKETLKVNASGTYQLFLTGADCKSFSKPFNIIEKPALTAAISGDSTINYGNEALLKFKFTSDPPYNLTLSDGSAFEAKTNPFAFAVKPLQTTDYSIKTVKNICGEGTVNGKAKIEVLVLGSEPKSDIMIYPNPTFEGINIDFNDNKTSHIIDLIDINGKVINTFSFIKDEQNVSISLKNVVSGSYFIRISSTKEINTFQIIKN